MSGNYAATTVSSASAAAAGARARAYSAPRRRVSGVTATATADDAAAAVRYNSTRGRSNLSGSVVNSTPQYMYICPTHTSSNFYAHNTML